ncbi:MAG: GGDEF domain-containing protein [Cytobacillus gottheilii]|uniref:GGDEF domain-containing protein n=1 Tax=Cytobacillus gottheilii TaxID=859144 RepID=UPI0021477B58|nr:GGDEF domain-containing protein [Cytobacillus gottheilii]
MESIEGDGMSVNIGSIAEKVPCISQYEKNLVVDQLFYNNSELQGIVVVNQEIPVGIITRTHFYQKIGTLYGYNLYMGRTVELLFKKDPLAVEYLDSITEVSKLAMQRKAEDLYDDVIVTNKGRFAGIVSIQKLLMKLVDVQVEFASFLNPLTRLPGNTTIEEKIKSSLAQNEFSIMYFDLDHFKAYNDTYGFKKGDQLLQSVAQLLKEHIQKDDHFLGHIGGDDFIAIVPHYYYKRLCENLMKDFNILIKKFYSPEHLSQQYITTEDRQGVIRQFPLVSISIAIVTNQNKVYQSAEELVEIVTAVKKRCKEIKGSCYLADI